MITSIGMGTGSLDLNLSFNSFTMNTTTMITTDITKSHLLVVVILLKIISRVCKRLKKRGQIWFRNDPRKTSQQSMLTYTMARGPLMPGTCSPNTNLSWDTRMWMAAAVVKPDTRVSDRYMTTKPTCRAPMASWKRQSLRLWADCSLRTSFHSGGTDTLRLLCFCHLTPSSSSCSRFLVWSTDLHDTSEECHRRSYQHSLFIPGQAFKPCDVGGRTLIWDQPGDHRANHEAQDWEGTCGEWGSGEEWPFYCKRTWIETHTHTLPTEMCLEVPRKK